MLQLTITDTHRYDRITIQTTSIHHTLKVLLRKVLYVCFREIDGLFQNDLIGRAYAAYNYQEDQNYLHKNAIKLRQKIARLTKNITLPIWTVSIKKFDRLHEILDFIRLSTPLLLNYRGDSFTAIVETIKK